MRIAYKEEASGGRERLPGPRDRVVVAVAAQHFDVVQERTGGNQQTEVSTSTTGAPLGAVHGAVFAVFAGDRHVALPQAAAR